MKTRPQVYFFSIQTTIRRRLYASLLITLFLLASISLHLSSSTSSLTTLVSHYPILGPTSSLIHVDHLHQNHPISAVSILLPAWKVLLIVSSPTTLLSGHRYVCLFESNSTSAAIFAGLLPAKNLTLFSCMMPRRVKRLRPFLQPLLSSSSAVITATLPVHVKKTSPPPELLRWTFLVYESFSTVNDVVLFAKGLNKRPGVNRPPSDFQCVFGDNAAVRTTVTSSSQEVFRCRHPTSDLTALNGTSVSLKIVATRKVVPSVAYYYYNEAVMPRGVTSIVNNNYVNRHELCACTMVYNVAKSLREWVTYHASIGVDRFFLYDNDSDDDLGHVVGELKDEGFNITTTFWIWPKTQEAGFSHAAVYGKSQCKWMMYIDVDEFVFSPKSSWIESPTPEKNMLKSLIPNAPEIGQVSIQCNEFGPSKQLAHPLEGVTQGYTCRRQLLDRLRQRHKSIVRLEAVEHSLINMVHHFEIKKEFKSVQLSMEEAIVNHYKYQAWPEFRTKFRRRVSAYVVDWTEEVNKASMDRAPGLGFKAVKPKGWEDMFCEVRDERLAMLTRKWFGSNTPSNTKMVWQS